MKGAQVFFGVNGIKEVYEITLKTPESICGFTDFDAMESLLGEEWMWQYAQTRAARGIRFQCIANPGPLAAKAKLRSLEDLREVKLLENIVSGMEIYILPEAVAIFNFEGTGTACLIEDPIFARNQKMIWQRVRDGLPA